MDLRQLRYFLAVVDHGGVRRAADALFVAQPSISQVIRGLEKDLGTPLFHRLGRRLVLTPTGEALIPPAREVLQRVELARSVVDAVGGLKGGQLVISSTSSQAASPLAPLIGRFLQQYPGIHVTVRAATHRSDVVSALRVGDAELGLIARPTNEAEPAELAVHPVEIQHYLCVARDAADLPVGSGPLRPEELAGARLIVGQPGTGMRRAADIVLSVAEGSCAMVEIEHRESLLPLVLSGAGVAVVAEAFREQAEACGLAVRALDIPEVLAVELLHRPGTLSPAAQAFLDVANADSAG
ncbi:LysR family transcriptional regulator [Corynebacterium halotolerans]|uniref:LysR family transcriptional regulator n=1 Tax=Corynebacterium halotolerans YIM 70093 = DSM 44683 TaxID=1121362 RepID=M1P3A7_9CORY|nr:LysR family transcriptional regulator [Corynebacterium halotolerans]AGF71171.1 LysR family transcriptional regulator [Corynebacterium halotolerans YIM 70093 = DSM 44683]